VTSKAVKLIRAERLLRDREAIRVLRKHFTGYEARDGFSLEPKKIAALPYHRRRALRQKYAKVEHLLSQPHDVVKPKTPRDAKALRTFTHERMRRMKHFIVPKPSEDSHVTVKEGRVELTTQFPGQVEFTEQYFMFPRRGRSHEHLARMLEKMLPTMPDGMYSIQTDTYGDIQQPVHKKFLLEEVQRLLEAYDRPKYGDHRFMNRLTGFRWMSTTVAGAEVQQAARDERREAQREWNRKRRAQLKREARARARRETK
jgi:hypothetical protein